MPDSEIHGSAVTKIASDINGVGGVSLDIAEIGASYPVGKKLKFQGDLRLSLNEDREFSANIAQAFLCYQFSKFKQLKVCGALIKDTDFGYELNNSALNLFVKTGLLFDNGPGSFSGVKGTLQLAKWLELGFAINTSNWSGLTLEHNNFAVDNNNRPAGYLGLGINSGKLGVLINLGVGPENEDPSDLRTFVDVVANYQPSEQIHLGLNADYGNDENRGANSSWYGAALYFDVSPKNDPIQVALRGQVLRDQDGFITGVENYSAAGATLSVILKPIKDIQLRVDVISQEFGLNKATPNNSIFGFMLVYSGSKTFKGKH